MRLFGVDLTPLRDGFWVGEDAGRYVSLERWGRGVALTVATTGPDPVRLYGEGKTHEDAIAALGRDLERQESNLVSLRRALEAGA